jgi:hypothetical protein
MIARQALRIFVVVAGLAAACVPNMTARSSPSAAVDVPIAAATSSNTMADEESARLRGRMFSWSLAGEAAEMGQCREEWSFGDDDTMTIFSGEEHVTKRIALRALSGPSMFELTQTRLTTNGRPDCQGQTNTAIGQSSRIYLQFLNGGGFFTCASTDTLSCYGVATPKA